MKVVIDIPKEIYNHTQRHGEVGGFGQETDEKVFMAIANGTPLPKGHGDLIDRQDLIDGLEFVIENGQTNIMGKHNITAEGYLDILKDRPTIIPADKEGKE